MRSYSQTEEIYNWSLGLPVLFSNVGENRLEFKIDHDLYYCEPGEWLLIPDKIQYVVDKMPLVLVPEHEDPLMGEVRLNKTIHYLARFSEKV